VELAWAHHLRATEDAAILQNFETLDIGWDREPEHDDEQCPRLDVARKEQARNGLTVEKGEAEPKVQRRVLELLRKAPPERTIALCLRERRELDGYGLPVGKRRLAVLEVNWKSKALLLLRRSIKIKEPVLAGLMDG
jgi:hypothetical protein